MKSNQSIKQITKTLFRAKHQRRCKLAHLPFARKIDILVRLQKIAVGIGDRSKNKRRRIWHMPNTL